MGGVQHHFLAGTRSDTDVQYAVPTATGVRYQDLHIPQSALDGSCGLVCVLVAVMVLLGIPRARIEGIAQTKREPLRTLWQLGRETYFAGTEEPDIQRFIATFPNLTCDTVTTRSTKRIGSAAATAVGDNQVPMVRFTTRNWSHWAIVIGVEIMPGERVPRALLLLDPSAPRPWCSQFNARLELRAKPKSGRFSPPYVLPYRYSDGDLHAAHLQGLVVVQRSQPP